MYIWISQQLQKKKKEDNGPIKASERKAKIWLFLKMKKSNRIDIVVLVTSAQY